MPKSKPKEKMAIYRDIIGRIIYWKVYLRHDIKTKYYYGYTYAHFERKVDPKTKKVIKSGIYQFNTKQSYKREAENEVKQYLAKTYHGDAPQEKPETPKTTMTDVLTEYWKSYKKKKESQVLKGQLDDRRKKRSLTSNRAGVRNLLQFFNDKPLKKVTPELIDAFIDERQTGTKQKKGVSDGTVQRELNMLIASLNLKYRYTKSDNVINSQLKDCLKAIQNSQLRENLDPAKKSGFFTWQQFEDLKANSPDWLKNLEIYLYYTGARIGEAVNLTWNNVNIKQGFVVLDRTTTKEREEKKVYLPKVLIKLLDDIYSKTEKNEAGEPVVQYVFPSVTGKRLNDTVLYKQWHKSMKQIGLVTDKGKSIFTPHCFRRTFVRNAIDRADFETVKQFTGHKTDSMLSYYNIRGSDDTKELANKLDDIESEEKEKIKQLYDRYWTSD